MVNKQIRIVPHGMRQDTSVTKFSPEFSFANYNIRIDTTDSNTLLTVSNINDDLNVFTEDSTLGRQYYLGYAILNEYLVVFSKDIDNLINPTDHIRVFTINTTTGNLELINNGIYTSNLNFSKEHLIEAISFYENEQIQKVYFIDGINSPRVINIMNIPTVIGNSFDSTDTIFDFVPVIASDLSSISCIKETSGGSFSTGTIQYAYSYISIEGAETKLINNTSLFYISPNNSGGTPDKIYNNSFTITISNPANQFKYIRVYSIFRPTLDGPIELKQLNDISIYANTTTYTFTDTGSIGTTLDSAFLYYIGGEYLIPQAITQKDNTLFLGNIKAISSNPPQINIDSTNIKIAPAYRDSAITYNYDGQYHSGLNYSSNQVKQFHSDQYYRLGIQGQTERGEWGDPIWLGDAKMTLYPSFSDTQVTLNKFNTLISEYNLNILKSHYKKIRSVIVNPTKNYRNVLGQGIATNTLFFSQDRLNGIEAGFPDYLTRPNIIYNGTNSDDFKTYCLDPHYPTNLLTSNFNFGHWKSPLRELSDYSTAEANPAIETWAGALSQVLVRAYPGGSYRIPSPTWNWTTMTGDPLSVENNFLVIDENIINLWGPEIEFDNIQIPTTLQLKFIGIASNINTTSAWTFNIGDSLYSGLTPVNLTNKKLLEYETLQDISYGFTAGYDYLERRIWTPLNNAGRILARRDHDTIERTNSKLSFTNNTRYYKTLSKKNIYCALSANSYNLNLTDTSYFSKDTQTTSTISTYVSSQFIANNYHNYCERILTRLYPGNPMAITAPGTTLMSYNANNHIAGRLTEGAVLPFPFNINFGIPSEDFPWMQWWRKPWHNSPETAVSFSYRRKGYYFSSDNMPESGSKYLHLLNILQSESSLYEQNPSESILSSYVWIPAGNNISLLDSNYYRYEWSYNSLLFYTKQPNSYQDVQVGSIIYTDSSCTIPIASVSSISADGQTIVDGGEHSYTKNGKYLSLDFIEGDTYVQRYDCLSTYGHNDENTQVWSNIVSFMCESYINLDGSYTLNRYSSLLQNNTWNNYNLINPTYSQSNNIFQYSILDPRIFSIDQIFPNKVIWSLSKSLGTIVDNWTNITQAASIDLDGSYGPINSLQTFGSELYSFQDQSVANIIFNARVQIPASDNIPIEISNNYNVSGYRYISTQIGCQNKWSIISSPNYLYFIDDINKSIHKLRGQQLEDISVKCGMKSWCNKNLSSTGATKYIDGTIPQYTNIMSGVDNSKNYIYFMYPPKAASNIMLAYSEILDSFISFYYPVYTHIFNFNDYLMGLHIGTYVNTSNFLRLYEGSGINIPSSSIEYIVNPDEGSDKIWNNLEYRGTVYDNMGVVDSSSPIFNTMQLVNDYQDTGIINIDTLSFNRNTTKKFNIWRTTLPRESSSLNRMRSPWIKLKLTSTSNNKLYRLYDMSIKYTIQ